MSVSDIIETFIKNLMEEADGLAEIQRNELANYFNCVPSQISYVVNSRFTNDKGYIVESRRGGGGSIRIRRIQFEKPTYLMHMIAGIGDDLSQQEAAAFIQNFLDYDAINEKESKLMAAAVSDRVLGDIHQPVRDMQRAMILKNMVLSLM